MNKKITIILGLLILILSLIGSELLIEKGIDKVLETKTTLQEESNNQNISLLEIQKKELIAEEENLIIEQLEERTNNGESKRYQEISNRLTKINEEKKEIDFEISKYKNGYYDNNANLNKSILSGMVYIIPGILVFIISLVIIIVIAAKLKGSKKRLTN